MEQDLAVGGSVALEVDEPLQRSAKVIRGGLKGGAAGGDIVCTG